MTTASTIDQRLTAHLVGPRPTLDQRSAIATTEVVDIDLAGIVAAGRYVVPARRACLAPRTPLRSGGRDDATAVSELLHGEAFDLFDCVGDWGFGRSVHDRYTGWVALAALGDASDAVSQPVTARLAPVFSGPDIKASVIAELPFGASVSGALEGRFVALNGGGFVHYRHVAPFAGSALTAARMFTGAPYLWGGRTPLGVDCSGLVQAALATCGIAAPRDSDQQRESLGTAVPFADRQAGDIVFFPGHVGMLVDADTLLHANAHWMAVVEEPLADVVARGAEVLRVRRVRV
jgi:hypothetical protein